MRSDVSGQVIATAECAHANAALEWLLTSVNTNVAGQFIGSTESTVAIVHWAFIWSFVQWRFARSVRIFALFQRQHLARWRTGWSVATDGHNGTGWAAGVRGRSWRTVHAVRSWTVSA